MAALSSLLTAGVAAATAGAGIYSANKSAKAAKQAGQGVADATDRAADLQNQQFQQLLGLQMPAYRLGQGALGVYSSALGLPGFALMGGGQSQGALGQIPMSGSPMTSGSVWGGYLASNPDVAAEWNKPAVQQQFGGDQEAYASWHYQNYGQNEGRQLPAAGALAQVGPQGADNSLQGQNAGALQSMMGGTNIPDIVRQTPGYQTQVSEGIAAIQGAQGARGMLRSGATLKGLQDFGQRTFGDYYQRWLQQVGALGGLQQSTAQSIGQAGQQSASSIGNLMMAGAQARGQGAVGAAQSWSEGLGGALGSLSPLLTSWGTSGGKK